MLALYNVSNVSYDIYGSSAFAFSGGDVQNRSFVNGRFTIASAKIFELRHRFQNTVASTGRGNACGISFTVGHETYAICKVWKLN